MWIVTGCPSSPQYQRVKGLRIKHGDGVCICYPAAEIFKGRNREWVHGRKEDAAFGFCIYGLVIWTLYQHLNLLFKCSLLPQFLWLCTFMATRSRFCNTFTLSESFKRPKIQTEWLMRPKIIFNLKFEVLPATQNTKDTEFPSVLPVLVYSGVPSRQQAKRGLTSFWRHFRKFDCSFRVGGDFYHTSPNKRSSSVMRQTP